MFDDNLIFQFPIKEDSILNKISHRLFRSLKNKECLAREFPLDTWRAVSVRRTSYVGPSDENYWETPREGKQLLKSPRRISVIWGLNADVASSFVLTLLERSKDVQRQKLFGSWILTSFVRVSFDVTSYRSRLDVMSRHKFPDQEGRHFIGSGTKQYDF